MQKGKIMKLNYRRVPTRFGPERRFELKPAAPAAPFRALQETKFDGLKNRLLQERVEQAAEPAADDQLRRAANEAASLAWVTLYPLLVFPSLFEEKAEAALAQAERQEQVRQRSRELLGL